MDITSHAFWSLVHGMGFGGLYLLACSGAILELWRRFAPSSPVPVTAQDERFIRIYFAVMAALAWLAVLTGAYLVYPWYRAIPPAAATSLSAFPQRLLLSNRSTAAWHSVGMEWKEHVAWLAPISTTMACAVLMRHGRGLKDHPQLRNAVLCFVVVAMVAAGIAGFFGAEIDDHAPVEGGKIVHMAPGG
ncbi:MAG TPA: hypothetical protein VFE01_08965 [Terracidiphilus sp.]|jgi:hypothetical protein|nr:hypothetical protein [Terracidiphilus sp.]